MGFYVSLNMPKDCPMCPFAHYDRFDTFTGCDITRGKRWAVKKDKEYAESSTRPNWCPLIEVTEPHGRLIDADALRDNNCDAFEINGADGTILAMDVSIIDDAPTIIPAEEGE